MDPPIQRRCVNTSFDSVMKAHYLQFDVPIGDAAPAGGRPPKIYRIKVTKVAEINTEYAHGQS